MNRTLEEISKWLTEKNLQLSLNKFEKKIIKNNIQAIEICGKTLNIKENVKYLSVIFQQNISWEKHIRNVVGKAYKWINVLKSLWQVTWGTDPKTMLMINKAIV